MKTEKQRAFIIRILYYIILLGAVYIAIKFILPLLMPFVIGLIIAMTFRPSIDFLEKKFKIKRIIVSVVLLLLFYGVIGVIISFAGIRIVVFVKDLVSKLPALYENAILPALEALTNDLVAYAPGIEIYLENFMNDLSSSIVSTLKEASSTILSLITGFAGYLPSLLISLVFTIVSSFFFTIDYYRMGNFIMKQFDGSKKDMVVRLKANVIGTLGKFVKAYASIISITFLELSIGFWILKIPTPFFFGFLVALVDILPILGTGGVLIPWAIVYFLLGKTNYGIGMLLLYIVITVVRQSIEPKIVGKQIGLHPIVTLLLMFVGVQLMGLLGLLLLPIIATILVKLNDEGAIHLFK